MKDKRGRPERIGDILAHVLRRRTYAQPLALQAFGRAWERAAGTALVGHTRVSGFRGGTLTIAVASAALRYELEAFRSVELLTALRNDTTIPPVTKLQFRITDLRRDDGAGTGAAPA